MDVRHIDVRRIREAASLLALGKLLIVPTETVYGLAAAASKKEAVDRIYALKERSRDKPLTWHLADYDCLNQQGITLPPLARELSWRFLPGPITIIVPGINGETLGIRFPDHPVTRLLLEQVGEAVVATSVNKAGEEPCASGKRAARIFEGQVDLVIDSGVTRYGTDSTVVDLSVTPPTILRRGPMASEMEEFLGGIAKDLTRGTEHVLFVCSGNTCRSVMAGGWLGSVIERKSFQQKISFSSCGTIAIEGVPATREAIQVARDAGAEIAGHQARPMTKKLLQDASRIFAMTASHADQIVAMDPASAKKIAVLGIQDPIGMDIQSYRRTLEGIKEKLGTYLPWLGE